LNLWKSKNKQLENTGTTGRNKRLDTGCKQNCGQTDEILHERPKLSISLNLFSHLKNELAIVKVRVKVITLEPDTGFHTLQKQDQRQTSRSESVPSFCVILQQLVEGLRSKVYLGHFCFDRHECFC
jgi:hypothetical protein